WADVPDYRRSPWDEALFFFVSSTCRVLYNRGPGLRHQYAEVNLSMRLSRTSRYALHALAYLTQEGVQKPKSTHVISEATGIPNVSLLKALKPLVSKRILFSITGPNGGYMLTADPAKVTILDIIEAVDGAIQAKDRGTGDVGLDNQL